jgi:hypothetical protein
MTVDEGCIDGPTNCTLIVYLTPDGAQLSDVSLTEFDWSDEMEYNRRRNVKTFGPWFVMSQSKPAKAVFVHEHCWPLLTKHFTNEEVNLDTLFEVCRDIPHEPNSMFHSEFLIPRVLKY